jgi:hypothetical protein
MMRESSRNNKTYSFAAPAERLADAVASRSGRPLSRGIKSPLFWCLLLVKAIEALLYCLDLVDGMRRAIAGPRKKRLAPVLFTLRLRPYHAYNIGKN